MGGFAKSRGRKVRLHLHAPRSSISSTTSGCPMKRKPKPLATRNPFVVLAMKRKAGSHRKPNKAIRRAEKVNLYGDVAQCKSIWLLTDRQGFDSLHPTRTLSQATDSVVAFENVLLRWRNTPRVGFALAAALVLETSAFGRVGSSPTFMHQF